MNLPEPGLISASRALFHQNLLAGPLEAVAGIPSIADKESIKSVSHAQFIARRIGGIREVKKKRPGQTLGREFEQLVAQYLQGTFLKLNHLRPGNWKITQSPGSISQFEQYQHLEYLLDAVKQNPRLRASLGGDYLIQPDVIIARVPEPDETLDTREQRIVDEKAPRAAPLRASNSKRLILHASISCKWTLRSDRGQNARTEALNLTRNRKGWVPHAVLVTAEPLPSRIQSVTGGMGDLDCVYHIALPELRAACEAAGDSEVIEDMICGRRLRDIADLPLDMAV